MKRLILIFILVNITVCIFGQDFCMYYNGEKICHEISATKILVKSETHDTTDIKNTLHNMGYGNLQKIHDLGEWLMIEMQHPSRENMMELQRQLNMREDIVYTSPIFVDERGIEGSSYTNEVIISLKSKESYSVLQEWAKTYNITDIKLLAPDSLGYLLTLPHNPPKDAAQTGLEMYETGLCRYTCPNIITLWPFGGGPDHNIRPYTADNFIYPNPVNDVLNIDLEKIIADAHNKTAASYDIALYNSSGSILRSSKAQGGTVRFHISDIPDGIYILNIYNNISAKNESFKVFVKH